MKISIVVDVDGEMKEALMVTLPEYSLSMAELGV